MKSGNALNLIIDSPKYVNDCVECSTIFVIESLLFGLCHSNGRGLTDAGMSVFLCVYVYNYVCLFTCTYMGIAIMYIFMHIYMYIN
jgi:hypothetical protein